MHTIDAQLQQYHTDTALSPQEERFVQLLVIGRAPLDAYLQVYALEADEKKTDTRLRQRAKSLATRAGVLARLAQLRAPVIQQAQHTFAFTLDLALERCQRAYEMADSLADPSTMLKAVELQAKLKKLLVSVVETRVSVLDGVSTEDLLVLLTEIKGRRAAVEVRGGVSEAEVVGGGGDGGVGGDGERGVGVGELGKGPAWADLL